MKTIREFAPGNRYFYDGGMCSESKGFAQIDTSQDASYFGTWANPETLTIVCYCEGDVTFTTAETPEEFVSEILKIRDWNNQDGNNGFKGIDCGWIENGPIQKRFESLGLSNLLH
mgnify:FL=1